jgi:hypothetical protein
MADYECILLPRKVNNNRRLSCGVAIVGLMNPKFQPRIEPGYTSRIQPSFMLFGL